MADRIGGRTPAAGSAYGCALNSALKSGPNAVDVKFVVALLPDQTVCRRLASLILVSGLGLSVPWVASAQSVADNAGRVDRAQEDDRASQRGPAGAATQSQSQYQFDIVAPEALVVPIRERTLLGRWRDRPDYDPDQFESLYARLVDEVTALARLQGYFSPKVSVSGNAQAVRVEVDAGPQTRVRRVAVQLLGAVTREDAIARQIRAQWTMPEASPFLPDQWERSKRVLIEALRTSGYLRARLAESHADIDPVSASADLTVVIDSGQRLRFGDLRIEGLERYESRLVENLRTFSPGEPYLAEKLARMQTRLSEVGYFSSATVAADLQAIEEDPLLEQVAILVEVREIRARRVALGAGFSTDNGPRAQLGLDQRNLFGTGWQAESVLLVEGLRQRLFANVRSPVEPDGRYIGLGGRLDRQDIAGERVLRTSTYGGLGQRRIDGDGFLALTHQYERRRLEAGDGQPVERDTRAAWVLGYTHTLNRVDSLVDPRKGYAWQAQLSGASRSLGSDRSFVRTYFRSRHFWPMASDGMFAGGTLIGMAELGAVLAGSRDDIPSENLFRTGGAQSLRGYRYLSIGVPDGGAVTGGRYLGLGSLEYQHPITAALRGALFYDRGNATDSLRGARTYAGYGTGVRWKTPVGPVLVDLAWGEESNKPRLHFAVGYGF